MRQGDNSRQGYSLPGDGRGRDLSGHRKKLTNQGALTLWRQQREGLVRTWKETDQLRRTHTLETAEGGLVGTRKKMTNRGTLTNWRR